MLLVPSGPADTKTEARDSGNELNQHSFFPCPKWTQPKYPFTISRKSFGTFLLITTKNPGCRQYFV